MSNFIIEDLKNSWNKKDNGLIKIIIINVIIFLGIGIIKIFLQIGGLENLYSGKAKGITYRILLGRKYSIKLFNME